MRAKTGLEIENNQIMQTSTHDSDSVDKLPFAESVYSYLYTPQSTICSKTSAVVILIAQILFFGLLIYGVLLMEGDNPNVQNNSLVPLMIKEHGRDGCVQENDGGWKSFTFQDLVNGSQWEFVDKTFYCTRYSDSGIFYVTGIPVVGCFLFSDVIIAIYHLKTNFCASLLILLECLMALIAAVISMTASTDSPLTTLLGGVAVMFVHDIDEAMKKGIDK
eukprot:UN03315